MLKKRDLKKKEEVMEEQENIIPFSVIQGGLTQTAGKEPPQYDWLSPMKVNTVFLAAAKQGAEPFCGVFRVLDKSPNNKAIQIDQGGTELYVLPDRFCNRMKLVDILENGE